MALRPLFCLFLSDHLRQVSMYCDETEYMHRSRNFRQGGPDQSDKKALMFWVFFFVFLFLFCLFSPQLMTVFFFGFKKVLSLFYRSQMVNFKENYHFSRLRRGGGQHLPGESNFFQGESNFFQVGGPIAFSL